MWSSAAKTRQKRRKLVGLRCARPHPTSQQEGIWHATSILRRYLGRNRPRCRVGRVVVIRGADGNAKNPNAEPEQASTTAERDLFAVPDGTIEELQKYIEGLNKIQPSSSLRPAVAELHQEARGGATDGLREDPGGQADPGAGPGGRSLEGRRAGGPWPAGRQNGAGRAGSHGGSSRKTWSEGHGPRRSVGRLAKPRRASDHDER